MSKEIYNKWFNEVVNTEKNYDVQADEAADTGWYGAKYAVITLLKANIIELQYLGETVKIISADIIDKIEDLM